MPVNAAGDISGPNASPLREVTRPDPWTIAAIAIVASAIADVIHEGLGHGGMCVITGGHPLALSTVHFDCSADTRLVAAGGTLANLIFGGLFWVAARKVKRIASWRYFFWLLMTFNLLEAGGYFLFSGIGNIGDWAEVVAGWQPAWAWRVGLTGLGAVTYFLLFVPLCLRELRPFLGRDAKTRVRRARQLTLVPYLISGILSCAAGALNPVGPLLILISAAAASLGGHSGLAWMSYLLYGPRIPNSELQMPEIERSRGWVVAAVILAIVFIAGLGPGIFPGKPRSGDHRRNQALVFPMDRCHAIANNSEKANNRNSSHPQESGIGRADRWNRAPCVVTAVTDTAAFFTYSPT